MNTVLCCVTVGGGRFGGGGRGHGNELVGKSVRIKAGPFKGYKGRVTEVKGVTVRVELDSQMKNVTGITSHSLSLALSIPPSLLVWKCSFYFLLIYNIICTVKRDDVTDAVARAATPFRLVTSIVYFCFWYVRLHCVLNLAVLMCVINQGAEIFAWG